MDYWGAKGYVGLLSNYWGGGGGEGGPGPPPPLCPPPLPKPMALSVTMFLVSIENVFYAARNTQSNTAALSLGYFRY